MTQFTQGQKVVLERNFDPETRASAPGDGITLPEMGQVYTVRAVTDITGFGDVLFLEEIVNPTKFYFDAFQIMEQGFDPTRFRLVTRHNPAPLSAEEWHEVSVEECNEDKRRLMCWHPRSH